MELTCRQTLYFTALFILDTLQQHCIYISFASHNFFLQSRQLRRSTWPPVVAADTGSDAAVSCGGELIAPPRETRVHVRNGKSDTKRIQTFLRHFNGNMKAK